METTTSSLPLDGYNVLDLSRFIAGPTCAQILGDFGAEVIKVERPGGEDARHHQPYYRGESVYTMLYNRNKYGVSLDTRHPEALAILEDLIRWADIVVENYRPGTLAQMGIGYSRMKELNDDIILVSISGFGQTGPDSRRALFDAIAQASSGLMSITGDEDGQPMLAGTYVADYTTGYQAALGCFAAVVHHQRTGEGQLVDVASLDSMFAMLGTRLIAHLMLDMDMPRSGNRDLLTAPVNVYDCADGSVYIQAGTNPLFPKLCAAIGRLDLLERPELLTVPGRMQHARELESYIAEWAKTRSAATIGAELDAAGVPYSKISTVAEVAASPQIQAREMIVNIDHPTLGPLQIPGIPIKMDRSAPTVRKAPPLVGEDNDDVYSRVLGFSAERIERLREAGAI
ncbi:CaiB/BaiF CoA-transferase family protein [Microbacterium sp. CJ77]|uniref:CaiB/BaiF CoA transferase family protein n=1 Tax=Microbacterium sp. CJ77 TaxID=2079201 RepID=UPI000CD90F9F|nr:CoA transferase [Microbacterium sp. CJ77]